MKQCSSMSVTTAAMRPFFFNRFLAARVPRCFVTMIRYENRRKRGNNLEEIFQQKRELRSKVRKGLKSMNPILRSEEDNAIQRIVLEAPWFKCSQNLCAYISCSALREVDTSVLLSEVLQNSAKDAQMLIRKKVYVPRIEDKNSNMRMLQISRIDDLIRNSMNILEPAPVNADGNEREDVMQANDPVDLFLLPGLAFDRLGRRLGRGGGYYDKFLKEYQELVKQNWRQPLLVALSYSEQIMDAAIPVTPFDIFEDALDERLSPTNQLDLKILAFAANCWLILHPSNSGLLLVLERG